MHAALWAWWAALALGIGGCAESGAPTADDDAADGDDDGVAEDDDGAAEDDDGVAEDDDGAAEDDDAAPSGTAPTLSDFSVGTEGAPAGQLRAEFAYSDPEGDVSGGKARIWGDGGSVMVFPIEFPDQVQGLFEFDLPVDDPGWGYESGVTYTWHATLQDRAGNISAEVTAEAAVP